MGDVGKNDSGIEKRRLFAVPLPTVKPETTGP